MPHHSSRLTMPPCLTRSYVAPCLMPHASCSRGSNPHSNPQVWQGGPGAEVWQGAQSQSPDSPDVGSTRFTEELEASYQESNPGLLTPFHLATLPPCKLPRIEPGPPETFIQWPPPLSRIWPQVQFPIRLWQVVGMRREPWAQAVGGTPPNIAKHNQTRVALNT